MPKKGKKNSEVIDEKAELENNSEPEIQTIESDDDDDVIAEVLETESNNKKKGNITQPLNSTKISFYDGYKVKNIKYKETYRYQGSSPD